MGSAAPRRGTALVRWGAAVVSGPAAVLICDVHKGHEAVPRALGGYFEDGEPVNGDRVEGVAESDVVGCPELLRRGGGEANRLSIKKVTGRGSGGSGGKKKICRLCYMPEIPLPPPSLAQPER